MFHLERILIPACIFNNNELSKCNSYFKRQFKIRSEEFIDLLSFKDKEDFKNFIISRKRNIELIINIKETFLPIKITKLYKIAKNEFILTFEKIKSRKYLGESIFKNSMDGILVEKLDRTIIDINRAISKITGYKRKEVIGKNSKDFVQFGPSFPLRKKPGGGIFKFNVIAKNGNLIPIEARTWMDNLGGERVVIGILRDVSDYKNAIEELTSLRKTLEKEVKSHRIIMKALSRLGVGIAIFQDYKGISGAFREANSYLLKVLGCKREELIGKKSFREFLSEEFYEKVVENYKNRIKGENPNHLYEIVVLDRKGNKHLVLSNIERIKYKGKPAVFGFYMDITEKRQKEKELYEKEKQITHIANNINGFLWQATLSPEGKFENNIVTKGIYKITGYTPEEMLKNENKFLEIVYKEDLGEVKKAMASLKRGKRAIVEFRIVSKKGEIRWLHANADVIKGKDGFPIFSGFVIDITERKDFERKLRNLNLAIQASNEIFIMVDLEGKIQYVNPAFERKTGYKLKEVKGNPVSEYYKIIIPDHKSLHEKIKLEIKWQEILYRKVKGGGFFKVFSSFSPILDSKNMVIGYFIIERDLSEEDRLINKLNSLFDSLTDLGFSFLFLHKKGKKRGLIKFANIGFFKKTGFLEEEIIEKKYFTDIIVPIKPGSDMLDVSCNIPNKAKLKGKDKEYIVEFDLRELEYGGEDSIFVLIRDVTEREKLEERLRRIQKYEAMGVLAGGIAHDFNNILSAIMGYIYLLKRDIKSQKLIEKLEKIEDTAKRASNLTKQLIGFARKGKYEITPIDVVEHIGNVLDIIKASVDRRISINFSKPKSLMVIEADPSQFEQVIMNVLLNSIEAIPKAGEIKIKTSFFKADKNFISMYPFVKSGEYVEISVKDTGIGMSNKVLERIFEPFFTTKEKGSGLGLSNVYGIVRNHGGFILVESEKGVGTEFKIYFPRSEKSSFLKEREKRKKTGKNVSVHRKILIVEDENIVREMLGEILARKGFNVIKAKDGLCGVKKVKENSSIDLVILDMNMPRMSGKEAFFEIKKINPDLKVLIATGYAYDNDVRMLIDKGAEGFIQKPYKGEEILSTIEKVLFS